MSSDRPLGLPGDIGEPTDEIKESDERLLGSGPFSKGPSAMGSVPTDIKPEDIQDRDKRIRSIGVSGKAAQVTPADGRKIPAARLIKPNKKRRGMIVPGNEAKARMEICKQCPELSNAGRCRMCGCFMILKARLNGAQCPLQKW